VCAEVRARQPRDQYEEESTFPHPFILIGIDLNKSPFKDLLKYYELETNTIDFIGHALALYTDDSFLELPCREPIEKIQLYMDSHGRYGDSPFIYPVYGLGGIPEGFARLAALHGGTFMLNTDAMQFELDGEGRVCGVRSGEQVAKCGMVICDPSYALNCGLKTRLRSRGKVIRCICILDHPIPNTHDATSAQVIIP